MNAPDRTTFIGGSDVGAILGVSPWKTPFQLFMEKTGAYIEEISPAKQRILDRGHRWEPIVLEMMVDELRERGHDVKVLATGRRYIDPEFPFLACELDAELLVDGEEINGEMKTANHFAAKGWGDYDADDIPIYYAAQGMHGLMIRPRRRVVFAAVTGFDERPMIRWLDRDEETIAAIRAKELAFWQRIQVLDAPDPETVEDVKWLYQRDGGTAIEADSDLEMLCHDLKDLKSTAKNLDASIELLATKIKARMGTAATLLGMDGKPLATWKNNKDSTGTDWKAAFAEASKSLDPEIAALIRDAHTATKPGNRPFLLK
jgi:putative phage-type endonuclease